MGHRGREHRLTRGAEGHQVPVKKGVEVGAQQGPVEHVEAVGVGGALGPGPCMAGSEELRDCDAGDGTGAAPVIQQAFPEDALAHTLAHEPLDLRRGRGWGEATEVPGDGLLIGVSREVGQGSGEPSRMGQKVSQGPFGGCVERGASRPEIVLDATEFLGQSAGWKLDDPSHPGRVQAHGGGRAVVGRCERDGIQPLGGDLPPVVVPRHGHEALLKGVHGELELEEGSDG